MSLFATILIVDDEKNTRDGLKLYLEGLDYDVLTAEDGIEAMVLYEKNQPDVVLADIRMPRMDGIVLLEKIRAKNPNAKVILLTAYGSVDDAVKAMKKGAFYYLTKPVNLEEMEFLIKKALASRDLEEENLELRQDLYKERYEKGEILTHSENMKQLIATVDKIAKTHSSVLIEGESGTGKELIAHRIHESSSRRTQPFVAVHCAALTETLLASELFGHERGAFTGATEKKVGRFERADRGTLFLDEIGEISRETQVKLLRVLQDGEFERVGGVKTIKADVRLIAATNKNLLQEVKESRFREDLYYRINVIYLKVPPLRERKSDIPLLVEAFVKHFSKINGKKILKINNQAIDALVQYDWPGNIRELKNIIERMVVLSNETELGLQNVSEDIRKSTFAASPEMSNEGRLTDLEEGWIRQRLSESKGNKSLAAKKLGISRRTLYRKIREYGL